MNLILLFLILICKLNGTFQKFNGSDNCGIISPKIVRYIYGGKFSMIEQWPWQVITKIIFYLNLTPTVNSVQNSRGYT